MDSENGNPKEKSTGVIDIWAVSADAKKAAPKRHVGKSRISARQVIDTFWAWMSHEKNITLTAQTVGLRPSTVSNLVKNGRKIFGIPPFEEMAENLGPMKNICMPTITDKALEGWQWDEEKNTRTMLMCAHLMRQAVAQALSDGLQCKTVKEAVDLLDRSAQIERAYSRQATDQGLVKEAKNIDDEISKLSIDELEKLAGEKSTQ